MSVFNVELKKVVDDSYDIEIGYNLMDKLVEDMGPGFSEHFISLRLLRIPMCGIHMQSQSVKR